MQTAIFMFVLFGTHFGIIEYHDANHAPAYQLCIDDGFEGVCYDASFEVVSAYDCGPSGCVGF